MKDGNVIPDECGPHIGLRKSLYGRWKSVDLNEHQVGTISTSAEQGRPGSRKTTIGDRVSSGDYSFW